MAGHKCRRHSGDSSLFVKRMLLPLGVFVAIFGFIVFLIWAILRPSKPSFDVHDATVLSFNLSSQNVLSTNIQVTFATRNPNARIGIYYDRLDVYAMYRSQQITLPYRLPSQYLGQKDSTLWSPVLQGDAIPVSPYLLAALGQDKNAGLVMVNVKVDGKVRWKVGTWISGSYHLNANCPAYLTYSKSYGAAIGPATKYNMRLKCSVEVWL